MCVILVLEMTINFLHVNTGEIRRFAAVAPRVRMILWGVSSAAYQTEGAENEDGRGESVWDSKFTQGKILGDMNGKIACDHYHKYKEDVELLKKLGIKNYRFSISWSEYFQTVRVKSI